MVWLWLGCVPMSAYGLRMDGLTPDPGHAEVTVSGGAAVIPDNQILGAGATGALGLTDNVALSFGAGFAAADGEARFGGAADVRIRAVREEKSPLNLTIVGGIGMVSGSYGVHGGLVASVPVAKVFRPYCGFTLDLPLTEDVGSLMYGTVAGGGQLRVPLDDHLEGIVGAELAYTAELANDWGRGTAAYLTLGVGERKKVR